MKIDKVLDLIEKGFSAKTISKLNESQIDVLHSKLIKEEIKKTVTNITYDPSNAQDQQKLAQMGVHIDPGTKKITMSQSGGEITTENELDEQGGVEVDKDDASQGETTQTPKQKMSPDGMDDDSDDEAEKNVVGAVESIEESKKKKKLNPWAICHAQVGPKKTRKFERCVKSVKKQLEEGKNPVSLYLENKITNLVERAILPRITKGDLMKYLSESENFATKHIQPFKGSTKTAPSKPKTSPTTKPDTKPNTKPKHPGKNPNPGENPSPKAKKEVSEQNPATAPSKPKTSPTTKPGTKPNTKPKHPGKNPNPGENPSPKAKSPKVSPEKAKDDVLDLIMTILKK